jgi:hypothetical protein
LPCSPTDDAGHFALGDQIAEKNPLEYNSQRIKTIGIERPSLEIDLSLTDVFDDITSIFPQPNSVQESSKRGHTSQWDVIEPLTKRVKVTVSRLSYSSSTVPSIGNGDTTDESSNDQKTVCSAPFSFGTTFDLQDFLDSSPTDSSSHISTTSPHYDNSQPSPTIEENQSQKDCSTKTVEKTNMTDPTSNAVKFRHVIFSEISTLDFNKGFVPMSTVLKINYSLRVEQYSGADITIISQAANFFLSVSLLEDAFKLYLLVWKRLQHCAETSLRFPIEMGEAGTPIKLRILLACVRSATTPNDLDIIQRMLEKELHTNKARQQISESVPADLSNATMRRNHLLLLLYALLLDVYKRQGKEQTERPWMDEEYGIDLALSQLMLVTQSGNVPINIASYYYYIHLRPYMDTPSTDFTLFEDVTLTSLAGNFGSPQIISWSRGYSIVLNGMRHPCVRNCVEWCEQELKMIAFHGALPSDWEYLKHDDKFLRWYNTFKLYRFLWLRWITGSSGSKFSTHATICMDFAAKSGITVAELIYITCSAILSDRSPEIRSGSPSRYSNEKQDLRLLNTARKEVIKLKNLPDKVLADKLFLQFLCRQWENHSFGDLTKWELKNDIRKVAVSLAEKTLNIHLPRTSTNDDESISESESSNVSDTAERTSLIQQSDTLSSSRNTTLAPSYRSSQQSSMLRLAMRIKEARYSKRSSGSIAPSKAFRFSYIKMFNKPPSSVDRLSDSMSSMNLSTDLPSRPNSSVSRF